jgi:hypothetical protein
MVCTGAPIVIECSAVVFLRALQVDTYLQREADPTFLSTLQAEGQNGVTAVLWAGHNELNVNRDGPGEGEVERDSDVRRTACMP